MHQISILQPGDRAALEAFLLPCVESSMFLLGNMRAAGLVDRGQLYEGTYAAAHDDGEIVAVVAHYWNRNLVFQAPTHLDALWRAAVKASGRPIRGLIGPSDQVGSVKATLGLGDELVQLDETEHLYSLPLDDLVIPGPLRSRTLQGRRAAHRDLDLVTAWRVDFCIEALGEVNSPQLWSGCRTGMERSLREGRTWVLEEGEQPVACSSFNTAIAEAVQIGGVWTPPELRNRGYGRAVVAASLLDARAEGAAKAILFTGEENVPAQKAYEALGFCRIGDYRVVLLRASLEYGG